MSELMRLPGPAGVGLRMYSPVESAAEALHKDLRGVIVAGARDAVGEAVYGVYSPKVGRTSWVDRTELCLSLTQETARAHAVWWMGQRLKVESRDWSWSRMWDYYDIRHKLSPFALYLGRSTYFEVPESKILDPFNQTQLSDGTLLVDAQMLQMGMKQLTSGETVDV